MCQRTAPPLPWALAAWPRKIRPYSGLKACWLIRQQVSLRKLLESFTRSQSCFQVALSSGPRGVPSDQISWMPAEMRSGPSKD